LRGAATGFGANLVLQKFSHELKKTCQSAESKRAADNLQRPFVDSDAVTIAAQRFEI
jgi:hypothetical protein